MATQVASAPPPARGPEGMNFFGEVLTRRNWSGTVLTSLVHNHPRHVPAHEHPLPYFSLVLRGNYEEEGRRGFNHYQAFTLAFHPAYTRHTGIVPPGGARFFSAEVGTAWLDMFRGPHALNRAVYELQAGEITWLTVRLFREFAEGAQASDLAMESLLWEMLAKAANIRDTEAQLPSWWARAIDILHESFRGDIRIAMLAEEAGVHPVYFARAFRRFAGVTAGSYLRKIRVQFACRQLSDAERPLSEIAVDAGFADQSHMTRCFQRVLKTTPAALRRSILRA